MESLAHQLSTRGVDSLRFLRSIPPRLHTAGYHPSHAFISVGAELVLYSSSILGASAFLAGSVLFYSAYSDSCSGVSCTTYGAALFLGGSTVFLLGSCVNHHINSANDKLSGQHGIQTNSVVYIIANTCYTVGSIGFLPLGPAFLLLGIALYMLGSILTACCVTYDMCRACAKFDTGHLSTAETLAEIVTTLPVAIASVLFLVGSVFFVPVYYSEDAVSLFVLGSSLILFANFMSIVINFSFSEKSDKRVISTKQVRVTAVDGSSEKVVHVTETCESEYSVLNDGRQTHPSSDPVESQTDILEMLPLSLSATEISNQSLISDSAKIISLRKTCKRQVFVDEETEFDKKFDNLVEFEEDFEPIEQSTSRNLYKAFPDVRQGENSSTIRLASASANEHITYFSMSEKSCV